MTRRLIVSPDAQHDLQEIHDYIASDNPTAANRMMMAFADRFNILLAHPSIGRKRDELERGCRSIGEGDYVVVYRNKKADLEVMRVIHSKRDLKKALDQ